MRLADSKGNAYETARLKGRGGQAKVYRVKGQPDVLAKVYHRPKPGTPNEQAKLAQLVEMEEKLKFMAANPPDDPGAAMTPPHVSIAWPIDTIYKSDGSFAGYPMAHVRGGVVLLQVFNPVLRRRVLPGFDWRYLHRTARNLAAALGALHARGYVVGDLNESNVLVNPQALITVIDCDSFQVQTPAKLYVCPVGKAEYTPPELQGKSFAGVARGAESDSFGFGVLAYQLLLSGNHPFRAKWLGAGDPPLVAEKIANGWFPYLKQLRGQMDLPPRAPRLGWLHPRVAELLRCCFAGPSAKRPSMAEWEAALSEAEQSITLCTKAGHQHADHLPDCPWCGLPRASGQVWFCGFCGENIPAVLGFCPVCGAAKGVVAPAVVPVQIPLPAAPVVPAPVPLVAPPTPAPVAAPTPAPAVAPAPAPPPRGKGYKGGFTKEELEVLGLEGWV